MYPPPCPSLRGTKWARLFTERSEFDDFNVQRSTFDDVNVQRSTISTINDVNDGLVNDRY